MIAVDIFIALFASYLGSYVLFVGLILFGALTGVDVTTWLPDGHMTLFYIIFAIFLVTILHDRQAYRARRSAFDPAGNIPPDPRRTRILYLRSFVLDEIVLAGRLRSPDHDLKSALPSDWQFTAIGENNRLGVRMDATDDETWIESFEQQCALADVIIVSPLATPAMQRQLEVLASSPHIDKTLLFVPAIRPDNRFSAALAFLPGLMRWGYFRWRIAPRELPADFPRPKPDFGGYFELLWEGSRNILARLIAMPDATPQGSIHTLTRKEQAVSVDETFALDRKGIIMATSHCLPGGVEFILASLQRGQQPNEAYLNHTGASSLHAPNDSGYAGFGVFGGEAGGHANDPDSPPRSGTTRDRQS